MNLYTNLGVGKDSDDGAVALHLGKVATDGQLAQAVLPLLRGVDERALLRFVPSHIQK